MSKKRKIVDLVNVIRLKLNEVEDVLFDLNECRCPEQSEPEPTPTPEPTPNPEPEPTPNPNPMPEPMSVPRMFIKTRGDMGNWLPDYAKLSVAQPITSFNNLPDSQVLVIEEGSVVTLDNLVQKHIHVLCVKGTLRISRTNDTFLSAGTILVYPQGKIDGGVADDPIIAKCNIEFNHEVNTEEDPDQFMVGLVSAGGDVSLCGSFNGDVFAKLLSHTENQITVSRANGWNVGDSLIIACSRKLIDPSKGKHENEIRTITDIRTNSDGTVTITLDKPLVYKHDNYVTHITRNINITSVGPSPAHMLFGYTCKLLLNSVSVTDLGRTTSKPLNDTIRDREGNLLFVGTNQRARYPVHVHHNTEHAIITRNVVNPDVDAKWAITIHDSSATVSDNVVYGKLDGAGIVAEEGNEVASFIRNIILSFAHKNHGYRTNVAPDYKRFKLTDQLGNPLFDRGFAGYGIWIAGPFVDVIDNIIIGAFSEALSYNPEKLTSVTVNVQDRQGTYDIEKMGPGIINGNYIDGSFLSAIRFWGHKGGSAILNDMYVNVRNHFASAAVGIGHVSGLTMSLRNVTLSKHEEAKANIAFAGSYLVPKLILENVRFINWPKFVDDKSFPEVVFV